MLVSGGWLARTGDPGPTVVIAAAHAIAGDLQGVSTMWNSSMRFVVGGNFLSKAAGCQ